MKECFNAIRENKEQERLVKVTHTLVNEELPLIDNLNAETYSR